MKATGIVRRIDDLGRVVIPKEIRRTMRIREGDPLEIYTEKDGEVIFKKYSPVGELSEFAGQICESLHKTTEGVCVICDRDGVIAVSGTARKDFADRRISQELERIMNARRVFRFEHGGSSTPLLEGESPWRVSVAAPIISEGDVMGCVVFTARGEAAPADDVEYKLAHTVAGFLGRQMES